MKVLIEFEPNTQFQAMDGVDQEDSISLLLWCIFYNSLLSALQSDPERGYCIAVQPQNISDLFS